MSRTHTRRRLTWGRFCIYAVLIAWSAVCLAPVLWLVVTSLKLEGDITNGPNYVPYYDFEPSLRAWTYILADPHNSVLPKAINSAVIAVTSTLLALLFGALAIYALTRCRPSPLFGMASRSGWMMAAILATRILPPVAIALPLYMMAHYAGMLDTRTALIAVYTTANLPVAIWLLQPVLGIRATEQEEAAQLDGASHLVILFSVLLPMSAGGIAAVGFLIFALCWNEYLFAAYLATDHAMTVPPWIISQMSYKEAQTGSDAEEWANFSAATILMALPLLAVSGFMQKVLSRAAFWPVGR